MEEMRRQNCRLSTTSSLDSEPSAHSAASEGPTRGLRTSASSCHSFCHSASTKVATSPAVAQYSSAASSEHRRRRCRLHIFEVRCSKQRPHAGVVSADLQFKVKGPERSCLDEYTKEAIQSRPSRSYIARIPVTPSTTYEWCTDRPGVQMKLEPVRPAKGHVPCRLPNCEGYVFTSTLSLAILLSLVSWPTGD